MFDSSVFDSDCNHLTSDLSHYIQKYVVRREGEAQSRQLLRSQSQRQVQE